jgi:hypothetical protein
MSKFYSFVPNCRLKHIPNYTILDLYKKGHVSMILKCTIIPLPFQYKLNYFFVYQTFEKIFNIWAEIFTIRFEPHTYKDNDSKFPLWGLNRQVARHCFKLKQFRQWSCSTMLKFLCLLFYITITCRKFQKPSAKVKT